MSDRARLLEAQRAKALELTAGGPPRRTSNPFFGVGPITDGVLDEADARLTRVEFEHWLEENYRKLDETGRDLGPFTVAEVGRSMHRGYPADKFLTDMMREIHRYFGFPKENKLAVGLGGGHSGFTAAALHVLSANDTAQRVFVDTPAPESEAAKAGGFFRQSWGAQIIELFRYAKNGDETRVHFAGSEGVIPSAEELSAKGIKVFFGVGHETTGATTYSDEDIANILAWLKADPDNHHAVFDATSMLGAMPWGEAVVNEVMARCCMFMPFQKAIGGISGYYLVSLTPQALALIDRNQQSPSWAIPRQLKLAPPLDAKKPLSGQRSTAMGPIYDAAQNKMLGGVINTYSTLAFAETTFGLLRTEKRLGSVHDQNRRSVANRAALNEWTAKSSLIKLGVSDESRRGAAVTLLKVNDPDTADPAIHARVIARAKQLLAYDGINHPNGEHEPGLDVGRYLNTFPGTPGDFRAWIGGIRDTADITALLENVQYAWLRAKACVLEEELAKEGKTFPAAPAAGALTRKDDAERAYKVLVCDLVGLKFDAKGKPDHSAVKRHIEDKGGVFHDGLWKEGSSLAKGKIHFFYAPDLSTEAELKPISDKGQYDAVIAAATHLPKSSVFRLGGVRIGAGTGNMACECWGGGNGAGGEAPLMNTPSFNSRATAQMSFKALLRVFPDLPSTRLHQASVSGDFDTGKNLKDFPTEKLEGKRLAVIGYGNIGREMAKLGQAFNMKVVVHARPRHKEWIESEGFDYAASTEEAARGADVLTIHTGLGKFDAAKGRFENAGEIGKAVFAVVNDGAKLINYDRGECVDAAALADAMERGKIRFASIDADIFKDPHTGKLTGPLTPYLDLAKRFPDRVELLPHAAADTDHWSRVDGAKQAVDQIFDAIQFKRVTNLKGDLPAGYASAGSRTVPGVGKCDAGNLSRALPEAARFRAEAERMAAIWGALEATRDPARRAELIARHGASLVKSFNTYATLMRKAGLEGPWG